MATQKKKTSTKKTVKDTEKFVEPTTTETNDKAEAPKKKNHLRIADIDLREIVEVQSCFHGSLTYISKDGYTATWDEFGTSCYMSVEELLKMRNQQVAFFTNNWIAIVGDNAADVISFLQIERYYEHFLPTDDFDKIFSYDPEEIIEVVSVMSNNMKEAVARRAYVLFKEKKIDSIKVREAVEKATGYDLEE